MAASADTFGLARLFRAESGRILASLLMLTRDIDLAEDALQDAVVQATTLWSEQGPPKNKAAWLLTVARRRLIDRIRKEQHRRAESTLQAIEETLCFDDKANDMFESFPDERLRLIFTCSHPALAKDARIPLTLKAVCGLSVAEIARAYLCSESAMQQRLTRAKRKIRDAGIAYEVPEGEALTERLPSVLSVIYLLFNESYSAFEGENLTRCDLAAEAIRLGRIVYSLLPCSDTGGLLALLLLHESRRAARLSEDQSFIPLEFQDRSNWNQEFINEGVQLALSSLAQSQAGPYQLQAAISALHSLAPRWQDTDWQQIYQLYGVLLRCEPSPVIQLNQGIALAYCGNNKGALDLLNTLELVLKEYQPFYVGRAEIFSRLKNWQCAIQDYDKALALTTNSVELKFLKDKKDSVINQLKR